MDAGEHTLQVFHPHYEPMEGPFVVEAGKFKEVVIDLEREE